VRHSRGNFSAQTVYSKIHLDRHPACPDAGRERSGPTVCPPAAGGSDQAVEGSLFSRPGGAAAAFAAFLAVIIFCLTGCQKKTPSKPELRAVTEEVVAAAQRVAGHKSQIEIHPEEEILQTGATTVRRSADNIYVSLADPAQVDELSRALDEIARRHKLDVAESSNTGVLRFDFSRDGVRTHSIHVISPLAAGPRSPAISRAHPQAGRNGELAIIIDDMGHDRAAADEVLALPFRLTVSILPHLPLSAGVAEEAHRRGDQVMLHLPMEPEPGSSGPDGVMQEPIELRVGMSADQVNSTLAGMLETVPHAAGVNNHEGSRATADAPLMQSLMPALRARNLFFIDSRTTAATLAYMTAERDGVPAASRKVFLDDTPTEEAIIAQLELAARDAERDGSAIAIGHPHPATIAALAQAVPPLESRGIRVVFASDLAH
jgi:uncharacterized protein